MNYGRAIRVARALKGFSQKKLSEATTRQVKQSHISRIESGKRAPSEKVLQAIADGLEVPRLLLTLLASEPQDLKGIPDQGVAKKLGVTLAQLFFEFQDADN